MQRRGIALVLITILVFTSGCLTGLPVDLGDSSTPGPNVVEGYNTTKVETNFIELLNEERSNRSLGKVSRWSTLTELGENHSQNMAENSYVGHTQPDGDDIEDRYRERGLLPKCRLPIEGTDKYYAGVENAAKAHIATPMRVDWAEDEYRIYNEKELAKFLFEQWMHSPPHRKAMLVSSANQAGLGIEITGDNEVYASLELC